MRYLRPLFLVLSCGLLALPAFAQQQSLHWHNDLESAKSVAKETGRLVLVHFWTPSCGPCLALEQNVFSQPGVASALEAQLVPVKLNADENSATAQWFGINRVPTDVIITPNGQMIGKLVSPPTPAAYVAEVTALAGKHSAKPGQAFADAASAAPVQPQINAAYSKLNLGANTPPAIAALAPTPTPDANKDRYGLPTPSLATVNPTTTPPLAPIPPVPIASAPAAPPSVGPASPAPNQVANPYIASTTSSPPVQQVPAMPVTPPMQPAPLAASNPAPSYGLPAGPGMPPLAAAGVAAPIGPSIPAMPNVAPDPRNLPPGSPPLGFEGYCPVSMRNTWKWVAGNPQWGIVHRGRTYWFASQEEQKQFWSDPDRYTPALSGMDPVLAMDHQQQVAGKRDHSIDYDGLFYMFASEATLQQFTANPQRYSANVRQAMGIPRGRLVR